MQNKNNLKYLNALNKINGLGPQKMRRLMSHFNSPEEIWNASREALVKSEIPEALVSKIISERQEINPDQEWEKMEKENVQMLIETDPEFPQRLKEIPTAPYIIYIKGEIDLNAPMISIVGSRKFTPYGSQIAHAFAKDLTHAGITVVSGMALGIDAIAHQGALDARGKTIAVLGNSLDDKNIHPRNNFNLSREIIQQGALLSEYPIETSAGNIGNFPARNRIIAGLSLGTLAIEAGEKSGTLITANLALEFNREVFAVPGSIFSPQSIGTHSLLKRGAKLITSIQDILEEFDLNIGHLPAVEKQKIPASEEEKIILKLLSPTPTHIDNLGKLSKLGTSVVASTLILMELKGWAKNIGGQNYISL